MNFIIAWPSKDYRDRYERFFGKLLEQYPKKAAGPLTRESYAEILVNLKQVPIEVLEWAGVRIREERSADDFFPSAADILSVCRQYAPPVPEAAGLLPEGKPTDPQKTLEGLTLIKRRVTGELTQAQLVQEMQKLFPGYEYHEDKGGQPT